MHTSIINVRQLLNDNIDEKTRSTAQNLFKEEIKYQGVKVSIVHKIAKDVFESICYLPKNEILALCEELWKSGISEESYISCDWSYFIHTQYEVSDIKIFENWIYKYVNNWASCDAFCNHTIGEYIEMFPEKIDILKKWASSTNRWTKRAAAVSLIIPARKGLFLKDIFEIADILLLDKDDLVQKGYGWMLKATSQANQQAVFEYVMSKKAIMPRTALRYAIEKMPKELKVKAMEK